MNLKSDWFPNVKSFLCNIRYSCTVISYFTNAIDLMGHKNLQLFLHIKRSLIWLMQTFLNKLALYYSWEFDFSQHFYRLWIIPSFRGDLNKKAAQKFPQRFLPKSLQEVFFPANWIIMENLSMDIYGIMLRILQFYGFLVYFLVQRNEL